jgi:paraquat-inducible protein B
MNETVPPGEDERPPAPDLPEARLRRPPFQLIWLIPIVAAIVAIFLAWRAIAERGPTITLTFQTGEGLTAGQTRVRHKAVDLGTVETVRLSPDMSHVEVRVAMTREATPVLTNHARFWVVRPRLSLSNISGLETVLSGPFIAVDPGEPGGHPANAFVGLEEPPAIRSDQPGTSFVLHAERIGSLASGSPVFYRDVAAGEVLNYDFDPRGGDVTIHIFIRAPFDKYVRMGTNFWNASGVAIDLGAQGVQLRMESLQAALTGGIAFDTPAEAQDSPPSQPDERFPLFSDAAAAAAAAAGWRGRIPFIAYFEGSVRGLALNAPVELYGIQVGNVTDIQLEVDPVGKNTRVAVRMEVQPERIVPGGQVTSSDTLAVARNLVHRGLRAQLRTANLLTGQLYVATDFFTDAGNVEVTQQGDTIVLPTVPGGLDSLTATLGETLSTLKETLHSIDVLASGQDVKQSLAALNGTLTGMQQLVRKLDTDTDPLLKRLPAIAEGLEGAVDRINRLAGSADTGYGANSQFHRDVAHLLDQLSDTARSVRVLADYLDQHPEALLRGRTGRAGE